MNEEFRVGSYIYFGGHLKSFRVLRRDGDELEIQVGNGSAGIKTRMLHIKRDYVSSARPTLGAMEIKGFRRGVRSRAFRCR
ncbi:MAG: hypothetical protein A2W52_01365 [Candidatus Taylorbacteria bacterium RIFCSPHIGHO2_02_49_25]|uniref:Uncharacterized protein n=1 Tax=Candidatus Taylorbacteria bacterium RIFCSPHIGHO2_02_49_25 TaxID=1802305 RepID=A0A1G2MDI4_9BACT|nr:MAG: hypothetical protein UY62_C0049G0010 [Parcubacteria group bacterium GW2011_GWF2_50_9]OHA21219.1 MAG: hypothetical protein A2W52_01365 [Candidatus Taylorbacteria bacterium RIFCSPHIGHO2_02_49_25]OHA21443.1 MAG: hypothetical protein A2759_03505 [Candidatus Taylorbacteria bacterium RIFCSPHIGHO2_01_FULL_49_60]OHA35339.1 MAG: hypothetical protein A2W65_02470 [Candidatus Taylorbacteria bacterium RIFCSPLOWO2_02_50_13]OHA36921.1 MAG: hypothetical protein A3B27_01385 [Candidatus Taylorbacteria ba